MAEVIRWMGISDQISCRWKKVYGGLGVREGRRVKQLEDENRKLKQLIADLSLDKHIMQDLLAKKLRRLAAARTCHPGPGVPRHQRAARKFG